MDTIVGNLVVIPGGSFNMGTLYPRRCIETDESPRHEVVIGMFYMSAYLVTSQNYLRFCREMDFTPSGDVKYRSKDHPVVGVEWEDAIAYCEWLSERTGNLYRLPSEAEWEYACRAGCEGDYCFGDNPNELSKYAWFSANANSTMPVGEKLPNSWGLYDMHGNVWEWCADNYHSTYQGAPNDGAVWGNPYSDLRVLRGGSWCDPARACRSAYRAMDAHGSDSYGFRVVREIT